jgi:hypothetical protein
MHLQHETGEERIPETQKEKNLAALQQCCSHLTCLSENGTK